MPIFAITFIIPWPLLSYKRRRAVFGGVFIAKQAFFVCLPERFKSQIRIDSVGTVSCQQTVMMDFSGFTGFDQMPIWLRSSLLSRC